VPDYFVKLTAVDELHAEVALAMALADFVDGNNAWMFEVGGGFGLAAESFQVPFGCPRTQSEHFERHTAIETLLMGAINYALTATADFLEQFIVAEVAERLSDLSSTNFARIRVIRVWQVKTALQ
jgi:hypothetical protein